MTNSHIALHTSRFSRCVSIMHQLPAKNNISVNEATKSAVNDEIAARYTHSLNLDLARSSIKHGLMINNEQDQPELITHSTELRHPRNGC